ncbi:MAG: Rab family GTPase [Promethearchaeota archaeon]
MIFAKFKICVFGDGGVGKTTLVNRYLTGVFKSNYKITIGADFYIKRLEIDDKVVILQIWDFAGEDRFRFLLPRYAEGSSGGIFMYDITRYASIKNFDEWLKVFKEGFEGFELEIPMMMVGGKLDLQNKRTISNKEAGELAKKNNFFNCIECSAKTGENVEDVFNKLTYSMMEKII